MSQWDRQLCCHGWATLMFNNSWWDWEPGLQRAVSFRSLIHKISDQVRQLEKHMRTDFFSEASFRKLTDQGNTTREATSYWFRIKTLIRKATRRRNKYRHEFWLSSHRNPQSKGSRQGKRTREADSDYFPNRSFNKKATDKDRQFEKQLLIDFVLEAATRQQQTRRDNWRSIFWLISC